MSSPTNTKSPLDAAQRIVSELADMTPDNQLLAVKFATETLGLKFPAALSPIGAPSVHTPQPIPPNAPSGIEHSTNIRSFTEMKAPKSDQQFAAVVAYFYQFEARADEKKDEIDAEVMKEAARLAGRPQVERWNMTLTNAKNAGYLDSVGPGKFKISSVGENLVAITLPNNDAPKKRNIRTKLRAIRQRSNKKKR